MSRNVSFKHDCKCLPECEKILYTSKLFSKEDVQWKDNPSNLNGGKLKEEYRYLQEFLLDKNHVFQDSLTYNISKTKALKSGLKLNRFTDIGLVQIFLENTPLLKVTRDAKITLVDTIGTIGGTLGLFTGFSIFSSLELIYWIYRFLLSSAAKSTGKTGKPISGVQRAGIFSNLKAYLNNTTVHGLKYLAISRNKFERFVWTAIILANLIVSIIQINTYIVGLHKKPLVTTLNVMPLENVPFPAVTACYKSNRNEGPLLNYLREKPMTKKYFKAVLNILIQLKINQLNDYSKVSKMVNLLQDNCIEPSMSKNCFLCYLYKALEILPNSISQEFLVHLQEDLISIKFEQITENETTSFESTKDILDNRLNEHSLPIINSSSSASINENVLKKSNLTKVFFIFILEDELFFDILKPDKYKSSHQLMEIMIRKFEIKHNLLSKFAENVTQELIQHAPRLLSPEVIDLFAANYNKNVSQVQENNWIINGTVNLECDKILPEDKAAFEQLCYEMENEKLDKNKNFLKVMRSALHLNTHLNNQSGHSYKIPLIPFCFWDRTALKNDHDGSTRCHMFAPSVSDSGICYSFNMNKITLNDVVTKIFDKKPITKNFDFEGVKYVKSAGKLSGLSFVLDRNLVKGLGSNPHHNFDLYLHSPSEYPQVLSEAEINIFSAAPGKEYSVFVNGVTKFEATSYVDGLDNEVRGCVRENRVRLSFFRQYTKGNCRLECFIKKSYGVCGCVPWYYSFNKFQTCGIIGSACFKHQMRNLNSNGSHDQCNCYPLCDRIQFTSSVSSAKLPYFRHLSGADYNFLESYLYEDLAFDDNLTQTLFGAMNSENNFSMALKRYEDISVVSVFLENSPAFKITMDAKATTADALAVIGGNLSLFTGFSILSAFEFFYWIYRIIFDGLIQHFHKRKIVKNIS